MEVRVVNIEVRDTRYLSWKDLQDELCLGRDNWERIDEAGKGEDFIQLLDQWKDEEALTHGNGYWTTADIDEFLAFGWYNYAGYLGLDPEDEFPNK